jgi:glycosyltransferase involved in cell wall biosynthesis
MALRVNVVCRNPHDDRVIPRFSRYLAERLGWTLTAAPEPGHDAVYLSAYFETQKCKTWPEVPVAAYFTHYETDPPGNAKAKLFDKVAGQVDLRIATAKMYADYLDQFGPAVQVHPPVERDRFTIPKYGPSRRLVAGFSGFSYRNGRKGEDLAAELVRSPVGQKLDWRASGRGWPVHTERLSWKQMPGFIQGLDILVCTSLVEGVPMPPLEALSCGVSIVVPREVGLLDELPDVLGIHRYKCGDVGSLIKALMKAIAVRGEVDREALRAVTEPYSIENWCAEHESAIGNLLNAVDGGMVSRRHQRSSAAQYRPAKIAPRPDPVDRGTASTRGIYCVAFGDPARGCALEMMQTAKKHMPDVPIALCSDRKIGPEDVLIVEPDSDIGGRRAKLKAYELAPAEWESVLYLDADTEIVADVSFFFELIEDGWEFVICKDPHLMDTMHSFRRKGNTPELNATEQAVYTLHTLQYNGGVWAFGRNAKIKCFFERWLAEWETYAGRDQGALIRAMYTEPLKVYLLGNEWNTFEKYTRGIKTAGIMHYPGKARRWRGQIPGRIDSDAAWKAVERFEARRG